MNVNQIPIFMLKTNFRRYISQIINMICKKELGSNDFKSFNSALFVSVFYSSTLSSKEDSTFSSLSPRTPI